MWFSPTQSSHRPCAMHLWFNFHLGVHVAYTHRSHLELVGGETMVITFFFMFEFCLIQNKLMFLILGYSNSLDSSFVLGLVYLFKDGRILLQGIKAKKGCICCYPFAYKLRSLFHSSFNQNKQVGYVRK